mgnify:CR=1 FL=1
MEKEVIIHGADRKIQVIIDDLPDEMTMKDVDFNVSFSAGGSSVDFTKADLNNPSENVYVAPIETKALGRGELWMHVEVLIPDTDFSDGIRHEPHDVFLNAVIV